MRTVLMWAFAAILLPQVAAPPRDTPPPRVVSNRPAVLSGRFKPDQGEVPVGFSLIAFPVDRQKWTALRMGNYIGQARRDGSFRYTMRPGEYFVALARDEEMPGPLNPALAYEQLSKTAQRVTLRDGEQREIELTIPR